MSSSKGSKLFAGDRGHIFKILTISLSGLAVLIGGLLAYQQFSKPTLPNLISEDEAIQTALKAGDWNEQTLRDKKIETTLVHVRANGFSFIVEQKTLEDTLTLYQNEYPRHENQYLWIVNIIASNNNDWVYTMNAATGEFMTTS